MLCFTVPGDPQDVKVTPLNSTTIKVEWKPPQMRDRNGVILGYHVHVQEIREEVRCKRFIFLIPSFYFKLHMKCCHYCHFSVVKKKQQAGSYFFRPITVNRQS